MSRNLRILLYHWNSQFNLNWTVKKFKKFLKKENTKRLKEQQEVKDGQ